jgi:hypothetical protein
VVLVDRTRRGLVLRAALRRAGVRTVTTATPTEGLAAALATGCPVIVWVNPEPHELAEGDELAMTLAEAATPGGLWSLSEGPGERARLAPWREPIGSAMPRRPARRAALLDAPAPPVPEPKEQDDGLRLSREELDMLLGPWPGGG